MTQFNLRTQNKKNSQGNIYVKKLRNIEIFMKNLNLIGEK